jgi:sigma-B regulation protein RsbU (phosphoserine phosphatase)
MGALRPDPPTPSLTVETDSAEAEGLATGLNVLVLDDSPAQRNMVCAFLRKWGHRAISTGDPVEALTRARDPGISLILCDWMMPEMTGPEFCRCLRAEVTETYPYVLLLTSKNDRSAVPEGLAAGADDFLSKPVRPPELQARMNAGARIVAMQRELRAKNGLLETTLDELQQVYSAIDRDLDEARRLQMASLQDRHCPRNGGDVSLLLEASGHVGGDMVGHFKVCDDVVGLYSIDVSGHGVASAMLASRIAGMLSEASPDQNISMTRGADGALRALSPELAVARMNKLMLKEVQTDRYFTICIAFANLRSGAIRMVQAGHPHPMILRADGQVDVIGDGGPPVGLLPDMPFTAFDVHLAPGDRLLLYSDGLTECPDRAGEMLDDAGLITLMGRHRDRTGTDFLDALRDGLVDFAGHGDFPDDLSALLFSFRGRG